MPLVPEGLSNEDAAKFRKATMIEQLPPTLEILDRARSLIFEHRGQLVNALDEARKRVDHLSAELAKVDQFLEGDQLSNMLETDKEAPWEQPRRGEPTDLRERGVSGRDYH